MTGDDGIKRNYMTTPTQISDYRREVLEKFDSNWPRDMENPDDERHNIRTFIYQSLDPYAFYLMENKGNLNKSIEKSVFWITAFVWCVGLLLTIL